MRFVLPIIVLLLLAGGAVYAGLYFGGFGNDKNGAVVFIDAYSIYGETATQVEQLVHQPSTVQNGSRTELNALLETILTEDVTAQRRDTLARLAFKHLAVLRDEVDEAQSAQAQLYEHLQRMDDALAQIDGGQMRAQGQEIVVAARKRAELAARITSVLSETNDQTENIITRILGDGGNLTDEHIVAINESTEKAEGRHATLTRLYDEIAEQQKQIERMFTLFVDSAL